jgi:hypothetical protein
MMGISGAARRRKRTGHEVREEGVVLHDQDPDLAVAGGRPGRITPPRDRSFGVRSAPADRRQDWRPSPCPSPPTSAVRAGRPPCSGRALRHLWWIAEQSLNHPWSGTPRAQARHCRDGWSRPGSRRAPVPRSVHRQGPGISGSAGTGRQLVGQSPGPAPGDPPGRRAGPPDGRSRRLGAARRDPPESSTSPSTPSVNSP